MGLAYVQIIPVWHKLRLHRVLDTLFQSSLQPLICYNFAFLHGWLMDQ